MTNFADPIDTREKIERLLESLEPDLPHGVRFLRPPLEDSYRTTIEAGTPEMRPPNPVSGDPYADVGWEPMVLSVELFRPISEQEGWTFLVYFCLDDLLTVKEVRTKALRAPSILRGPARTTRAGFQKSSRKADHADVSRTAALGAVSFAKRNRAHSLPELPRFDRQGDSNHLCPLRARNLLSLRTGRIARYCQNATLRSTAGTREAHDRHRWSLSEPFKILAGRSNVRVYRIGLHSYWSLARAQPWLA
jgi:hypothetical protein